MERQGGTVETGQPKKTRMNFQLNQLNARWTTLKGKNQRKEIKAGKRKTPEFLNIMDGLIHPRAARNKIIQWEQAMGKQHQSNLHRITNILIRNQSQVLFRRIVDNSNTRTEDTFFSVWRSTMNFGGGGINGSSRQSRSWSEKIRRLENTESNRHRAKADPEGWRRVEVESWCEQLNEATKGQRGNTAGKEEGLDGQSRKKCSIKNHTMEEVNKTMTDKDTG
ncbi:hypothetical protein PPACK8108_LOCUS3831 [Phakopsora pachyrhizi]|uniref:Uncharacterized protein n=1 Tax=Phakopsora pachyrhizi TaxID=170000 RepID=A0AAV0AKY6_PHAPC|nr:hypothetical protein PPACK8108_LOCUS3831 [Phakopsora pachyrhizi]